MSQLAHKVGGLAKRSVVRVFNRFHDLGARPAAQGFQLIQCLNDQGPKKRPQVCGKIEVYGVGRELLTDLGNVAATWLPSPHLLAMPYIWWNHSSHKLSAGQIFPLSKHLMRKLKKVQRC